MERWELIERSVLLTVGTGLLLLAGWLLFFRNGLETVAWLVLLAPCIFWVFWQALFEDRLDSQGSPNQGERTMFWLWICVRGFILGGASLLLAFAAWFAWQENRLGMLTLCAVLAFVSGWVAAFGGGKFTSMSDDRRIHGQRMKRYN